ncbi:MAG: hypothetical protein JWL58_403 [Streptosporangiaceae bacterium]|nr:hypothetical protein [Streptosporangiaceae bacterium]
MVTELPPGAQARMSQARRGTWTSGLSVDEFACLRAAGFEPVGQVMGSTVHNLGWWFGSRIDCGYRAGGFFGGSSRTVTSGSQGGWGGYATYTDTLYRARRTAMGRMAAECAALGGDGVVAVRLNIAPFQGAPNHLEFQAFGTAVRAAGDVRPGRVFLSHLTGQDFGKLISSGWVPVDLALGISIGVRHDDWQVSRSSGMFAGNQEVDGWTELMSATRNEARRHVTADAARAAAEGVVLSSIDLHVRERECSYSENRHDHVVEATFTGTSIVRFETTARPPRSLAIMRL